MGKTQTKIKDFTIREATEADTGLILSLIRGLADYEGMPNEVTATEEILHHSLFEQHQANVIIGEEAGIPVCFALYFYNFSTFQGKHGLYLEDLFVKPEYRGKGYGSTMLSWLAQKAKAEDCGRFEWVCLDWNEGALKVYRSIGAIPLKGWTIQRLTGDALTQLAASFSD